jgi:hypothetical protein
MCYGGLWLVLHAEAERFTHTSFTKLYSEGNLLLWLASVEPLQ